MSLLNKVYETITAQSELVLDQQADDGTDRILINDSTGTNVAEIFHDGTNNVINPLTGNVDVQGALDTDQIATTRYATQYASIQAAINDLPNNSSDTTQIGEVKVPAKDGHWNENFDVSATGVTVRGDGINTRIFDSGQHTVEITSSDNLLEGFWVDETGAGSNDAVRVTASENRLRYLDIDEASQYGLSIGDVSRCSVKETQIKGGQSAAAFIEGDYHHVDLELQNPPADGLIIAEFATNGLYKVNALGTGENGVKCEGSNNVIEASIQGATFDSMLVDGDQNVIRLQEAAGSADAIRINGNDNAVFIASSGQVELGSGASDNYIAGRASNVNDQSGNSTNDYTNVIQN